MSDYEYLLENPRRRRKKRRTPPRGPGGRFRKRRTTRRRRRSNPAAVVANPRRRRRRRSTSRRRAPTRRRRTYRRRRNPSRRRSPRSMFRGVTRNLMDGAYLAGAAFVGETLTRLVMRKLKGDEILAKLHLSDASKQGLGMVVIGLLADPVLKLARVPSKFRSLVGQANIAMGIIKATSGLQSKVWSGIGLEDYYAPPYGILGDPTQQYVVPASGILDYETGGEQWMADYETVGDYEGSGMAW